PAEAWKIGGGTVWGWISYDADLDLVYYGTANPGPWNAEQRPGDNKWTNTIFARRPATGEAVWAYQLTPHDVFDYDAVNEQILVDLDLKGRRRKVLVRPERNGYVYVMDRATGEVLSATAFAHVNTTRGVDLATGRLTVNDEKTPVLGKVVRDICPAARRGRCASPSPSGAARWPPPATSFSTAPWIAGSRPCTRAPASCSGSSRPPRGSSASPSPFAAPAASSTSPSSTASAAGRAL